MNLFYTSIENILLKSLVLKKHYTERWLPQVFVVYQLQMPLPIRVLAFLVISHTNSPILNPVLYYLSFLVVKLLNPRSLAKPVSLPCSVRLARFIFAFLSNSLTFAFWSMSSRCWIWSCLLTGRSRVVVSWRSAIQFVISPRCWRALARSRMWLLAAFRIL